jgi:osmotically-inducible protein OsmY
MTNADSELRKRVIEELEWDPSFDASKIGVAAHNGVVALSGTVASYAEKVAAEKAAQRVKGVVGIAQELEVVLPSDKKHGDADIAERAIKILQWNIAVPLGQVTVEVEDSIVKLHGHVTWQYQKEAAEQAIRKLSGVKAVWNWITVHPRPSAQDVRSGIENAMKRSAELEAAGIAVRAEGGRVVLSGRVKAWYEREMAEKAAWAAPGVTEVDNRLMVGA